MQRFNESHPPIPSPLGREGCFVEWTPVHLIDPHEMAEMAERDTILLSEVCYGRILDLRFHAIAALDHYESGWCYLVQQIDPETNEQISGKVWWIDEEDLTFQGALRRRVPDASQIEVMPLQDDAPLVDFSTTTPLWWRSRYGA